MTTNEHIDKILAKCREIIAWRDGGDSELAAMDLRSELCRIYGRQPSYSLAGEIPEDVLAMMKVLEAYAGPAEAMARSTIAAIEGLRRDATGITNTATGAVTLVPYSGPLARSVLDAIRAAWPEEIL